MEARMQSPVRTWLQALAVAASRAKTRRRLRHEALQLKGMSERELLDLGIGRCEVPALLGQAPAR